MRPVSEHYASLAYSLPIELHHIILQYVVFISVNKYDDDDGRNRKKRRKINKKHIKQYVLL